MRKAAYFCACDAAHETRNTRRQRMHEHEEALIAAASAGDVERVLASLEEIHEKNCHDDHYLQVALDSVFSIRDSNGIP